MGSYQYKTYLLLIYYLVIQKLRWDDNQRWSRNFQTFHQFLLNKVVDIVPIKVDRGSNAERWIPKKVF